MKLEQLQIKIPASPRAKATATSESFDAGTYPLYQTALDLTQSFNCFMGCTRQGVKDFELTDGWNVSINASIGDAYNVRGLIVPAAGVLVCKDNLLVASFTAFGDFVALAGYEESDIFDAFNKIKKSKVMPL